MFGRGRAGKGLAIHKHLHRHRSYGHTNLAKKLRYMSKIAAILARADIYA
jgi:hypothetical protein